MAIEETLTLIPEALIGSVKILIWVLQAAGIFVIAYVIYLIVSAFINRKRLKTIEKMGKDLEEIKEILRKKK